MTDLLAPPCPAPAPPRATRFAARIAAATPPDRDRALDGLRALAIAGVVLGHFLVMALVVGGDGGLRVTSPLATLPGLAPVSWVLQLLGLFFMVGGYTSALGRARAAARGRPYRRWLRDRLLRLVRPVFAVGVALAVALPLLAFAGEPGATLHTTVTLVVQPLWFIAVYAVLTALTPAAVALCRRFGVLATLPPLALVALVDLLRYGPWAHTVPAAVGLVNLVPGWGFGFLLGVAWAQGRITRRSAALLATGGLALAVLLVLAFGYPVSMVGVPGAGRTNAHPPSLLVLALAAAQCGTAILLRDRLARLLYRPRLWAAVTLINLCAMSIFCWHQVALMVLSAGTLALVPGGLPGLHTVPAGLDWVGYRLAWLPVHLVVLGALVAWARRYEQPHRAALGTRGRRR